MHFITFPVASTNIFPLSNSTQGGQLVTEFNLKSRDMVMTNPDIQYPVGPSFIHSLDDFKVKMLEDPDVGDYDPSKTYRKGDYCRYNNDTYICISDNEVTGAFDPTCWTKTTISTSILQVSPGRAVVNGHYVEALAPMQIDLNLANAELKQASQPELYGNLSIGIKTYFSTENTMSGSMLVENTDNMYIGVQLVIARADEFKVPGDDGCKLVSEQGNATADIKLADFTYANGTISASSIHQNENAIKYIDSDRIYDFDSILDQKYISSENTYEGYIYTYSGKSGWCNSIDSLMVWDSQPRLTTTPPAIGTQARFAQSEDGTVSLVIPHKQPDIDMFESDTQVYYADKSIEFPTANYNKGTSGIVTEEYTNTIKGIAANLEKYKNFTQGKQIGFLDYLTVNDGVLSYDFPKDLREYNIGDYIVVREDYTLTDSEDAVSAPATMYFVLPGAVTAIEGPVIEKPEGIRLGGQVVWEGDGNPPTSEYPTPEELDELFKYSTYRGVKGKDYFELSFHDLTDDHYYPYYYPIAATGDASWSEPVLLTGSLYIATEDQVGGFYNASTDSAYMDAGYVYADDTGHLRLMDYDLLRTGALAYQLGADFSVPSNQTIDIIQENLDEYVNDRVAFKTNAPLTSTPTMINVVIPLPEIDDNEDEAVLNIYDIDSRFGTGVYLHFLTEQDKDYSKIIINITDCEKIRIDNSITMVNKGPLINVFRSCLYYDAEVINYVLTCDPKDSMGYNRRSSLFPGYTNFTGFDGLTLWYSRFLASDPELVVNGMEVSQPDVSMVTQDITFWSEEVANDNHYSQALRSITLSSSGQLIACSLFVSNNSTQKDVDAVSSHVIIGGDFYIPQGAKLNYPLASVTKPIMVTGTFTTAYLDTGDTHWIVTNTTFTAKSGVYSPATGVSKGTIAFDSKTDLVSTIYTNLNTSIAGWKPGTFHIFYGGTTTGYDDADT